jgi:hypothetical protein
MRPSNPRPPVTGPDSGPEAPFPIRLSGPVIKGFGRGSKEVWFRPVHSRLPKIQANQIATISLVSQQQTSPSTD